MNKDKNTPRKLYREAYRQARLLRSAITRTPEEQTDWMKVHTSALTLQGVPDWMGFDARRHLLDRETFMGDPMHFSAYFHQVRDGVLPKPTITLRDRLRVQNTHTHSGLITMEELADQALANSNQ
jgi:hypothetical protein